MKKILACIFAVSLISGAAFSKNFFTQRFFEIKVGGEAGFSNNLFAMNDFMKQDLVIDLRKIADECPKKGFIINGNAAASVEMNVNVKDFHVGFSSGFEFYDNVDFSKDLFDFLGYGNSVGETLNFSFNNNADLFAVSQFSVGFKLGKLKINVQPSVFLPIISVQGGNGAFTVVNDTDGSLTVTMDSNLNVYSLVDLKSVDGKISLDTDMLTSALLKGYGFDIGGSVAYQIFPTLSAEAVCRVPILPGHLYHKAIVSSGFENVIDFKNSENSENNSKETTVTNESAKLAVNRPLKFDIYVDKGLVGNLLTARAGVGCGVRRPFSSTAVFYPEYYLGLSLNVAQIFKAGVSTQYKDQIFIHQVGTSVNLRVFQLDLGVSAQSASFKKSLSMAGVGAYTYVSFGF